MFLRWFMPIGDTYNFRRTAVGRLSQATGVVGRPRASGQKRGGKRRLPATRATGHPDYYRA